MALNVFSLKGKGLKLQTVEDVKVYVKEIEAMEALEAITLSGNTISIEVAETFSRVFSKHPIKIVNFSDLFTGRLRSEIPKCLDSFTDCFKTKNIVYLDFSDNAFGPDGIRPLVPLISECVSLEVLKLNNTGLGPEGGKLLADALLKAGEKNKRLNKESCLKTLVCGRSRLENGSMKQLAEALSLHKHLSHLHLPQDGIRPEGIVDLIAGIEKCTELEVLDLQDNTFTLVGSKALAKALKKWPKLKHLNVGDCMLDKKGSIVVLESLKEEVENGGLKDLEVLNLQYCEMDEKGALLLAQFVTKFQSLKKLELNGNLFAEDSAGADAIRDALGDIEKDDVLGSLSDMEEEESEEEDEAEADEDDLVAKMEKSFVNLVS